MPRIDPTNIQPKRPAYMMPSDIRNAKIRITEEEAKIYTIAEHNARLVGLERSNIPQLYENIFKHTVMAQVMEPIDNAIICVDESGVKVNTNEGDFECSSCDNFCNDPEDALFKEKYPHGYCKFAVEAWTRKFGSLDYRPESLDGLQEKLRKIGSEEQAELTQDEISSFTKGLDEDVIAKLLGEIKE